MDKDVTRSRNNMLENVLLLLDEQEKTAFKPHELLALLGFLNLLSIVDYLHPSGVPATSASNGKSPENPLKHALQNIFSEGAGSELNMAEMLGSIKKDPAMLGNMLNLVSSVKHLADKEKKNVDPKSPPPGSSKKPN